MSEDDCAKTLPCVARSEKAVPPVGDLGRVEGVLLEGSRSRGREGGGATAATLSGRLGLDLELAKVFGWGSGNKYVGG